MATATVFIVNRIDPEHLATVKAEMARLGSPKIRAFNSGEAFYALEGSHRLAAAAELGVPVEFIELDEADELTDHDYQDLPKICTVADALEYGHEDCVTVEAA